MDRVLTAALALMLLAACQEKQQPHSQQPFSTTAGAGAGAAAASTGNARNGLALISQYGCGTCHVIPGAEGATGSLGPSLATMGSQQTLANGQIKLTPAVLAQYIQEPASVYPQSTMPPLGMPDSEANDIAAYLLTLK